MIRLGGSISKALRTAAIGGVMAAGVLVPATAAHATPSNCSGKYQLNEYWVYCGKGTGQYRARVRCYRIGSNTQYTTRYGVWRSTGGDMSIAYCTSTEEPVSGTWETM
jgi:hypothetical protein